MLVITRRPGESFRIGQQTWVQFESYRLATQKAILKVIAGEDLKIVGPEKTSITWKDPLSQKLGNLHCFQICPLVVSRGGLISQIASQDMPSFCVKIGSAEFFYYNPPATPLIVL